MMIATTDPRTLEAAFMAQAHSTRFPPLSEAGNTELHLPDEAERAPQGRSGKRHAHSKTQRDQQPGSSLEA